MQSPRLHDLAGWAAIGIPEGILVKVLFVIDALAASLTSDGSNAALIRVGDDHPEPAYPN
jgi:hypothetical protein